MVDEIVVYFDIGLKGGLEVFFCVKFKNLNMFLCYLVYFGLYFMEKFFVIFKEF